MEDQRFFGRLQEGLARTRQNLRGKLEVLFRRPKWDEDEMESMEEILITADVGMKATRKLLEAIRQQPVGMNDVEGLSRCLQEELIRLLMRSGTCDREGPRYSVRPWVVMFVGVNGVGKTTTIGKLAYQQRQEGKKVLLVAADTFRAAAIEQLEIWGERVGAEVIKHQSGQDPSGVVFDGVRAARKRGTDVVLIDTAGRLHTKGGLLDELKKLKRVIGREMEGAPHESLLVLDASTGQNALQQAKVFKASLGITGIVLTKLDGTAKGGVVVGIQEELELPVDYVGLGEGVDDLYPFDAVRFVQALFS